MDDRPLRVLRETEEELEVERHNDEMVPPWVDTVLAFGIGTILTIVIIVVGVLWVYNILHGRGV